MNVLVCFEPEGPGPHARAAFELVTDPGALTVACAAAEGPPPSLALAAAAAERLWLSDSTLRADNPRGVGLALAHLARQRGADVILAGTVSSGDGLGLVPAAIAHHLQIPFLAAVEALEPAEPDPEGSNGVVATVRLGALRRRLRVALPAVLAVVGRPGAHAAPVPGDAPAIRVLTAADVGLDPALASCGPERLGVPLPSPPEVAYVKTAREALGRS
jgi:electron transfer flavoprotein beta subunit